MNLLKIGLGKTLELSEFLCKIESGENGSLPQQYVIQTEIQPASRAGITVKSDESELSTIHKSLGNHKDLFELLNSAILDNNLSSVKEGGFIHSKYNSELSELSYILNNSNKLVTKLRESYRDLTGIAALKILHNNILGYYVEVSANHKITSDIFIHRQSLANSMRYTTNELKELENKILTARDAAIGLEMKIFSELCSEVAKESEKNCSCCKCFGKT